MKKLEILYPDSWTENETFYHHHTLPADVFRHKEYPHCEECGGKYVPLNKEDTKCLKCFDGGGYFEKQEDSIERRFVPTGDWHEDCVRLREGVI